PNDPQGELPDGGRSATVTWVRTHQESTGYSTASPSRRYIPVADGSGQPRAQPLARSTARRQRSWPSSSRARGSNRWPSRQVAASSAGDDHAPVASPARNAAPRAVVSMISG